ncbi:MAG TPA: 50S ribosomal protein L13 [Candidatus Saccharimonadales bacterium]|nr:50S ribosomal protein L13 [Candidatus Saccharimonadales bacterium]
MKTYSAKPSDVTRKWYVLDAEEVSLGRLSTVAATLLLGKNKPQFTTHIDTGDFVIVINAKNVKITGDKLNKKIYYKHSNYPGGLTETPLKDKLEVNPEFVITHAVRGMLPVNKLRDERLKRLKVYSGSEHAHAAQKPEIISLKEGK